MCDASQLRILDCKGVEALDVTTDILAFIRDVGHMLGHCYPERQAQIYIVNVSTMFYAIYRLVSPLIRPITRKKIKIVPAAQVQSTLLEVIDAENLPEEYGGSCRCEGEHGCYEGAEEQKAMRAYVRLLDEKAARGETEQIPEDALEQFIRMRNNALFMAG